MWSLSPNGTANLTLKLSWILVVADEEKQDFDK